MENEQRLAIEKHSKLLEELHRTVGAVNCPKCQTTITPDIVNCPLCGEKVN